MNELPLSFSRIIKSQDLKIGLNSSLIDETLLDAKFDFIFLKTSAYPFMLQSNLKRIFSRLRDGGVIGGGGYGSIEFPTVKRDVDAFFGRFGSDVHHDEEGTWWVEKKPIFISYIIPAYNCEGTIQETLDSIIFGNICNGDEIVIVDDASKDKTLEILRSYEKKYDFVRVFRNIRNKGGASTRNVAVDNSINDLIFCLDSDNVLAEKSVPKLKEYLIDEFADVASFQELKYFKTDKSRVTHSWFFKSGSITLADSLASYIVPASSGNYLYTKQSWINVGGYPEFARALDAWGFGIRQLAAGYKMVVLENTHYFHRHGHDSYWVRESKAHENSLIALQILVPFLAQLSTLSSNYISGSYGRNNWFNEIENLPLRTKYDGRGQGGYSNDSLTLGQFQKIKNSFSNIMFFIRSFVNI